MASRKPIVRQNAWGASILQFLFMFLLFGIFSQIIDSFVIAFDATVLVYVVLSYLLKRIVSHNQRKGMALVKKDQYVQAIDEFEKSYEFFAKHAWIDKYRCITLLSSSRISFKEMALVNIAFCYLQSGEGKKAKEYYEKTLEQFPDSEMAKTSLKMLESIANSLSEDSNTTI